MKPVPGFFDFAALYDRLVTEAPPFSVLVEIGVFHGASLRYLGLAAKRAGKGLKVVGVDWGRGQPGLANGDTPTANAALETLLEAGLADEVPLIIAPSWKAAALFAHDSVWAAFIDAGHEYADVRADIETWLPRIEKGGILCGHDYTDEAGGWPGVWKAVYDVFGPTRASPTCPTCWEVRISK